MKEQCGSIVIIGGNHITGLPHKMPSEFDYGVVGEGEVTLKELVEAIRSAHLDNQHLSSIKGIVFHSDGQIIVNPSREQIPDLDVLPLPSREYYPDQERFVNGQVSLMTSRGCPYDCYFCSSSALWKHYRKYSVDYILRDIDGIMARYHPQKLFFSDDLLIVDKKWLRDLCEGMLERGLPERVNVFTSGRANLIDDEVCELLKSINTSHILIGLESASDRVLRALNKRAITAETNQRALDLLSKHGIAASGTFIIGTPDETREDIYTTYQFIMKNIDRFYEVDVGLLRLFPGTKFWEYALGHNIIDEDHLTGVIIDREDVDGWTYFTTKYPRLGKHVPINELVAYQILFRSVALSVQKNYELQRLRAERENAFGSPVDQVRTKTLIREVVKRIVRKFLP